MKRVESARQVQRFPISSPFPRNKLPTIDYRTASAEAIAAWVKIAAVGIAA